MTRAMARWVVGATVGLTLAVSSSAHGAVRSGSQSAWPDGAFDVQTRTYNPSIERMDVRYDDTAATVTTTITLDRALAYDQYFSVSYALAKPQPGRSCANSAFLTQMAHFDGYVATGPHPYSGASVWFDPNSGYTNSLSGTVTVPSSRQYAFTVSGGQALTRQDLRCAMSLQAYGQSQEYKAANFCLGTCPTDATDRPPPPPPSTGPAAPTGVRASLTGQTVTLSWDPSRDPNFSYFAVRRDTQPNTNLNPLQWTRLPGNYTSPAAIDNPGPGTYFYYVTQINRSGQVSARSATVRVDVPPPVPPPPPPPPPPPTPPPTVVRVGGDPVVITPSSEGQRSVSTRQALRRTSAALRAVYKRAFTNARNYTSDCRRVSATQQRCRVSWKYKRVRYRGRVIVRLTEDGYATRIDVARVRR